MTDQEGLNVAMPAGVTSGARAPTPAKVERSPLEDKPKAEARRLNAENNAIKKKATDAAESAQKVQDRSVEVISSIAGDLDEAIQVLNESLAKTPTKAVISKDEDLNRFIVKIADKASGEIVREIPPEALLRFARHLEELKGLLFDQRT